MNAVMGLVVRSKAGRDKNIFFVITEVCGEYVYISDGRYRPLENQKKKNIKHLAFTAITIPTSSLKTNKQIKKALHSYNYGTVQS